MTWYALLGLARRNGGKVMTFEVAFRLLAATTSRACSRLLSSGFRILRTQFESRENVAVSQPSARR